MINLAIPSQRQGFLSLTFSSEWGAAYWWVGLSFLDKVFASWFQTGFWYAESWVGVRFREDFLYLFTVKFGVVESVFGRIESFYHNWAQFGTDCRQTTTKIFVSFKIGGNVERRSMTIVKVVPVCVKIAHVVDYQTGKLHGCRFNCCVSIVKQSKIRGW